VVDDNPVNLLVARRIIQHVAPQAHIQEASGGKLAVEMFSQNPPDIVLMDLQMPEINGIEATGMIRALESSQHKHTPIIAVTAGTVKGEREKCLAAGMDDFMPKPIDKNAMQLMLEKWLFGQSNHVADEPLPASGDDDDFSTLRQYRQSDKDFSSALEQESRIRLLDILGQIDQSIQTHNLSQLQKLGHNLRGTALNLGLEKIAATSLAIENLPEWHEATVKQLQTQIHAQIDAVIRWMDAAQ
jgi:CheY-like chemotaxis protein